MTNEEKELLLKDLCARLPYGVIIKTPQGDGYLNEVSLSIFGHELGVNIKATERTLFKLEECKPYLRPMSSMTEEEKWDFGRIFNAFGDLNLELFEDGLYFQELYDSTGRCDITWDELNTAIVWLNKYHFDYRGLISKGLALEAPEGMYII